MNDPDGLPSPAAPFAELSETLLADNISIFLRELIRRNSEHLIDGDHGDRIAIRQVSMPLPFSRADGKSYARIVELWNAYRTDTPIDPPPRPCPACRSDESDFQFRSYDQYPYHACRRCGTWFVPSVMDGQVIDRFLSTVDEARQISEAMMAGREETTRDSDRQRLGRYFEMLRPLLARSGRPRYVDIGCGVGHSIELATEIGWEAIGIESNAVAVATALAKGRNVRHANDGTLAGSYDVVSLFETLEHITDPDMVLADVARALAPRGVVFITVPNRASFEISLLRNRCFHVFGGSENVGHINLFDIRGIDTLLQRHGLSLMFTDGQFGSNLPQIFSHLVLSERSVLDMAGAGQLDFAIPELAHRVLNNVGPAFSSLERALKRSPILVAIGCRTVDRPNLEETFAVVEEVRRRELRRTIGDEADALRAEISRRDELLAAARARFDRTIEGRAINVARRVRRLARRLGRAPER